MISIITPVLNGALFIEKNIESISKLKIPFEHIIVDGGSMDGTIEIIKCFPYIKLLNQTDKSGMYGAIHQGIINSNGKYLAYVNADDMVISSGFEMMYDYISNNGIDVVYSDSKLLYNNSNKLIRYYGNKFGKYFLRRGVLPFIQPSSIFSKEIYFRVGGFRYNEFRICGDLDLFYRIAIRPETKFKYVKGFTSEFIVRDDSLGNLNSAVVIQEKLKSGLPTTTFSLRVLYWITSFIQRISYGNRSED